MVSINTNLQSLMVQKNLTQSTNILNQAIERMTTGFKINHASDNAANYSIADNMVCQMSSYDVAAENIAMGNDMVSTAQENIALMQTHAERIYDLITQAQNGTYGEASLRAINAEVQSRMAEIDRIYATTEYNGINILEGLELPDWVEDVKAGASANIQTASGSFIDDPYYYETVAGVKTRVTDDTINSWAHVSEVTASTGFTAYGKYAVSTADDLANLATLVNAGKDTTNVTFVMGADIDLTQWCTDHLDEDGFGGWTPIGDNTSSSIRFKGIFDGNGHKITGLMINSKEGEEQDYQGVFGYAIGELKNVGVEEVNIKGKDCIGGLVGKTNGTVSNSYSAGNVTGRRDIGGLVGSTSNAVTNSYSAGNVTGTSNTGGLVGNGSGITNSYSTGNITGNMVYTGGLVGLSYGDITNSYSMGNVTGREGTGGLAGYTRGAVTNSYAAGDVTGKDSSSNWVGGLIGLLFKPTGTLSLDKIASSGTVSSKGTYGIGSLIGGIVNTRLEGTDFSTINITNASVLSSSLDMIGFEGKSDGMAYTSGQMEGWLSNISALEPKSTTLQVGINGDESSSITFDTSVSYDLSALTSKGAQDSGAFEVIQKFINDLSDKATQLGAVANRLDSALESTTTQLENLTSSLSTIRDADVATESSKYIRAQILQQASATLLSTANQSPSIALQLL